MSSDTSSDVTDEFVRLLTDVQMDLWTYLLAVMHGHSDVGDVQQKTNIILWEKRSKFVSGTDFRAWALAIARYEVKAYWRSISRSPMEPLDERLLDCLLDEAPTAILPTAMRLDALEHCMSRLRPEDRRLLEHRYQSGKNLDEYARRTKRSPSSVSVSLFRLRAALKRCIEHKLGSQRLRS